MQQPAPHDIISQSHRASEQRSFSQAKAYRSTRIVEQHLLGPSLTTQDCSGQRLCQQIERLGIIDGARRRASTDDKRIDLVMPENTRGAS